MGGDIMQKTNKSIFTNKKQIVVFVVICSLVIAAANYFYYKNHESSILQQKYNELKAIADLKVNQIENWNRLLNTTFSFRIAYTVGIMGGLV